VNKEINQQGNCAAPCSTLGNYLDELFSIKAQALS